MSFGRMGARYGRMGASGAVAVERPTAPVLSLVEPVTDPPSFTAVIDDTVGSGDSYQLQVQADGGDWSTLLVDDTDTITSGEDAANQIDATVGALGAGNYDARMAVRDGSGPWSSWSNVVDVVIEASETLPIITYRTRAASASGGGAVCSATGVNIVNATEDLILVIGLTQNSARTVISGTVTPDGGSPINVSVVETSNGRSHIVTAAIPAGTDLTNAAVAITESSAPSNYPVFHFATIPAADLDSTTEVDATTGTASSTIATTDVATSEGGVLFAVSALLASPQTVDWTGDESLTENGSELTANNASHSSATVSGTAASAGNTVIATWSVSNTVSVSAVSFR